MFAPRTASQSASAAADAAVEVGRAVFAALAAPHRDRATLRHIIGQVERDGFAAAQAAAAEQRDQRGVARPGRRCDRRCMRAISAVSSPIDSARPGGRVVPLIAAMSVGLRIVVGGHQAEPAGFEQHPPQRGEHLVGGGRLVALGQQCAQRQGVLIAQTGPVAIQQRLDLRRARAGGAGLPATTGVTPNSSAMVFKAVRMVRREPGLSWAK